MDEKKVFGPVLLLLAFTAIFSLWPQSQTTNIEQAAEPAPTLSDSLHQVYDSLMNASIKQDDATIERLLDSREAAKLKKIARRFGHKNISSYLSSRIRKWPDLDTLIFQDIQIGDNYARLSYSHDYKALGENRERVLHTFILFHRQNSRWQYVTMTMLERERFDMYGYERDVHETDLPPLLRFPRII